MLSAAFPWTLEVSPRVNLCFHLVAAIKEIITNAPQKPPTRPPRKLDQWCFYHSSLPHGEETHGWEIWTRGEGNGLLGCDSVACVSYHGRSKGGWRWLQPWVKVSRRVKCQRLCKFREGKVVEGDVAHAPLVIHSLTCGKRIGNGNFSKCKYTLVKNMVRLMHTTCSSLARHTLFWREERLRNKGRGRYGEILRGDISETGWVVNVVWRPSLTLRFLHEHHLGVREEVKSTQEHHFAAGGRVALHALLLDQGELLCRALGCWRAAHVYFRSCCALGSASQRGASKTAALG